MTKVDILIAMNEFVDLAPIAHEQEFKKSRKRSA